MTIDGNSLKKFTKTHTHTHICNYFPRNHSIEANQNSYLFVYVFSKNSTKKFAKFIISLCPSQ